MRELLLVLLVAGCGIAAWLFSQDMKRDDDVAREYLAAGIDYYKQGRYRASYKEFEKAFQLKPSSDLVYAFIKREGDDIIASMMNGTDEKMRQTGHRLFTLAKSWGCLIEP